MDLPVMPPLSPMLAKVAKAVPAPASVEGGFQYEPKWDGFRCIIFRDGDEVELGSRNERPLTRYFPDVEAAARQWLPPRCVLDGEIIISLDGRLQFERLLERIHPADSRVQKLAVETPASFVAFDLLAIGAESLLAAAQSDRRARLVDALRDTAPPMHVTPATTDEATARRWFDTFEGAGLDGVVAKPQLSAYQPGARAMLKVKHVRTADVVLAGYRLHKSSTLAEPRLGSLLLGLYDNQGQLQHVGVAASFATTRRAELVAELAPMVVAPNEHPWGRWAEASESSDRMPGAQSRWNAGKDLSWVPLDPSMVVEVGFDHMEGTRFRHTTQFKRWRPDRDPKSCTYAQLEEPVSYDLDQLLQSPPGPAGTP
ncbi:MAG: ATP-dependent DNA ligase [Nocardioidaceae bacterium]|nr:ATP-dependent DNA ligase [Nocardioidaceae bacterium]